MLLDFGLERGLEHFIFGSSGAVYGKTSNPLIKEHEFGAVDVQEIANCYDEAKRMGEMLALSYSVEKGIRHTSARIATAYGPGIRDDSSLAVNTMLKEAQSTGKIVVGNPRVRRSFTYLSDTTRAIMFGTLLGENGAYNCGSDFVHSMIDLAEVISGKTGCAVENLQGTVESTMVQDVTKLNNIGYTAKVPLDEGVDRLLNPNIARDVAEVVADPKLQPKWSEFAGKTVIVTGAAGMLPSYMVFTLMALETHMENAPKVIGVVRNLARAKEKFATLSDNPRLELVESDLSTPLMI
jgi:nucleoside-diphosphate-sugar epimerase